jgi:acyl-CoA hydrolase
MAQDESHMSTKPQNSKMLTNPILQPKTPSESEVTMTEMVLPQHTNSVGGAFGGTVMSWIDIAAAIAAGRHSRRVVVTASIDALHFISPIKLGAYVHIRAAVNFAGKTSMEIGVRVDSENPLTGEIRHNVTAYTTFVALDDLGAPTQVPPLKPETQAEKRRHAEAIKRRESRIRLKEELKQATQD